MIIKRCTSYYFWKDFMIWQWHLKQNLFFLKGQGKKSTFYFLGEITSYLNCRKGWLQHIVVGFRFPNATQVLAGVRSENLISLACGLYKIGRDRKCSYISDVPTDWAGSSKRDNRRFPFEKAAFGKTHAENERQVQLEYFQPCFDAACLVYKALWKTEWSCYTSSVSWRRRPGWLNHGLMVSTALSLSLSMSLSFLAH